MPLLTWLLKPVTGVIAKVVIVKLPPPAVLVSGVVLPVAPVALMVIDPMVSVLPLKSNCPALFIATAPTPIMSVLAPVYCTTGASELRVLPMVNPDAAIAFTAPLLPS